MFNQYPTRAPQRYMHAVYSDGAICPRFVEGETPSNAPEWINGKSPYVKATNLEGDAVMVLAGDIEKFNQWKRYESGDYSFVSNPYEGDLFHIEQQLRALQNITPEQNFCSAAELYLKASEKYAEAVRRERERTRLMSKRDELVGKATRYERTELARMYGEVSADD